MSGPIRAFIAVEIKNKKLLYAIGKLQEKLVRIVDRVKLVELENIHITIRFLGDISEVSAKKLYNFLEEEVNSQYFLDGHIEFTVRKLSDFSKRVFHLGLQGPVSILREIHDKIDDKLVYKQSPPPYYDLEKKEVYISPVCGYTNEGDPPDNCPVCGAVKKVFKQIT